MPILSRNDTPPSRYPDKPVAESRLTWWIAKVKPRREKVLARELLDRQTEYYLPYYKKRTLRNDCSSHRVSLLPLFPSYVPFACEGAPWALLKTECISTILPVKAQLRFIKELNTIYLANERNIGMLPMETRKYTIGQYVRVIAGSLRGIQGPVVRIKGVNYLYLLVEGLGGACIEIAGRLTEPCDTLTGNSKE